MISVIIPAHNEEKVIAAALAELAPGAINGELEIVVVCNGCTDNTAKIVTAFCSGGVKCIETSLPSKTNALNLGDEVAYGFPRVYQDADVVLSFDAVRTLANALQSGEFLAASPMMLMDCKHASWAVRSYYEIWQQLPYVKEGMIGTGVFALSQKGRERFEKFPQVIADDGYVRALFNSNERIIVGACHSLVRSPATLEGLLKIKTRSRLGRYELLHRYPKILENEEKKYGLALAEWFSRVDQWHKIALYIGVNLLTRFRAKRYAVRHGYTGWERDESSRDR